MSVDNRLPTNQSQLDIVDKLDEIKDAIVQGGGGGSSTFAGLSDVSINTQTLANGQVPKWNSTTSKWENGNAGGGSGGHTILDDDGTALAQQDDLQFVGVYSTDNSTDGVTEVNIYREMTRAEYDLLSDDEKKGFINITDEPSMASIIDGVFIDENNIIESITINDGSIAHSTYSYTATQDCIVDIFANGASGGNVTGSIGNVEVYRIAWTNGFCKAEIPLKKGQTLSFSNLQTYAYLAIIGIQQGSQVVKYNYSTEEQIVGTWIDGKTLYQKTYEFEDTYTGSIELTSMFSGVDTVFIEKAFCINASGAVLPLPYAYPTASQNPASTNDIALFIQSNKTGCGVRIGASQTLSKIIIVANYTKVSS